MRRLCVLLSGLLLLCGVDAQEDQKLLGDAVIKRPNPDRPMLLDDVTWNAFKSPNLLGEAPPSKPSKTETAGPLAQAHPPLNHTANSSQLHPPPLNDANRPDRTDGNPPKPVALAEMLETDTQQTQGQVGAAMEAKNTSDQHAAQWMQANMQTGVIVAVGGLVLLVAGVALRARLAANEQQAKQQREDHHLLESLLYNDMDYAAM